mgnify:CR=1 FL=1
MKISLFEPQIPENTGNILRTAACFKLEVNIIMPCGFVFSDKKLQRSAMDYLNSANYRIFNNWNDFKVSNDENSRIILATTKANTSYYDFKFKQNDIILFGNENSGVPEFIHKEIEHKIKIPLLNNMRSLNLAVASGIITSFAVWQLNLLAK